ncbi:inositol-pentakisphosphate 2-kinase [Chiua virens]|nr:inositol-pentakisphosphate 2-kinase [Chiua virens]
MARVNVAQTRPQDWAYLSEGGSTVVFSYTGSPNPHFTGKVLRLRKTLLNSPEVSDDKTIEEEDDPVITFQNTVMAALLPSKFLPDLEIVLLDADWLEALDALHNDQRPVERRAKDRIDKSRQKGILATDLIGGADILAIEIKPKWGFMPNPAHLSYETMEIKTSTCRFCMHTRYRLTAGNVPTRYCPLDLYSKDETRMRKAIHDLWDGWVQSGGTLNNMKVFVSGEMIRPSESHCSIGEFLTATSEVREAFVSALLPALQTPVLDTLSNLQRSLDALDIEGIVRLHSMTHPGAKELGAVGRNPTLKELQDFVASYRSVYCALDHSQLSPEHLDTYLTAYLLSATLKDCSIIIRIHRSDISGKSTNLNDRSRSIFVIDLDLKSVDRFEQWAKLDRKIVECYRNAGEHKVCVE